MEVPFVPQQECQWAVRGDQQAGPARTLRCKFTRELLPLPDISSSSVSSFYPLLTLFSLHVENTYNIQTFVICAFLYWCKYSWVSVCADVEANFIALSVVTSIWCSLTILHHICPLYCLSNLFTGHLILWCSCIGSHTKRF